MCHRVKKKEREERIRAAREQGDEEWNQGSVVTNDQDISVLGH